MLGAWFIVDLWRQSIEGFCEWLCWIVVFWDPICFFIICICLKRSQTELFVVICLCEDRLREFLFVCLEDDIFKLRGIRVAMLIYFETAGFFILSSVFADSLIAAWLYTVSVTACYGLEEV